MNQSPSLSSLEELILNLLIANQRLYGLELVKESNGRLKKGTIYVTLSRMEEKGYIEGNYEELEPGANRAPRRFYRPTALGMRVYRAWQTIQQIWLAGGEALPA